MKLKRKEVENMDKDSVTVGYDQEKLAALRIYLGHKNTYLEFELGKTMDSLYSKIVPATVREFIKEKEEMKKK